MAIQEAFPEGLTVASDMALATTDWRYAISARVFSVVVALIVLLVTLPIILMLIVAIRVDSPGPAVFRQQRLGQGARPFRFYKFRTMHADARQRFPELYAYQFDTETLGSLRFKMQEDPRLTRVGTWLRRTSLDELPNLLNVLKGDMNLVGPRPEIPEMRHYYAAHQLAKWSVPPGVTGLAQVYGRAFLLFQDTVTYDLKYVEERSFLLDLKVLWLTVWRVLRGVGAF